LYASEGAKKDGASTRWHAAPSVASGYYGLRPPGLVTTIKQGLGWAFAYNTLLIPVAAGALYAWHGILLNPVLAAAAMAMSSVSVVSNAQRLRRFRRPASAHEIMHPPLRARLGQVITAPFTVQASSNR
jgi:hypothetical protein